MDCGTGELRADGGGSGEIVVRRLDTSDLSSVRVFAKEVLHTEKAIHVLVGEKVARRRSFIMEKITKNRK